MGAGIPGSGTIDISGTARILDVRVDVGDRRDFLYSPPLIPLRPSVQPGDHGWWRPTRVRDQGMDPSCTGHALASIVDHLRARDLDTDGAQGDASLDHPWASARMLYSVARYHDDFDGENYRGSSVRGVLKGFFYNGVCSIDVERGVESVDGSYDWHMTRAILESARKMQLGSYFRVRPRLSDLHVALNDVGLVLASADIHDGWAAPGGQIPYRARQGIAKKGRHAFVLVGYDQNGFILQNSWGSSWGDNGLAHWSYEDWAENIVDLWVLRLGAPLSAAGGSHDRPSVARNALALMGRTGFERAPTSADAAPSRLELIGHVVPLAKGRLDRFGSYHTDRQTLLETVRIIRDGKRRYRHVLIHAMELQAGEIAAATLIRDMSASLKERGCYPIFILLENVLSAEIYASCARIVQRLNERAGLATTPEKDHEIEGQASLVPYRLIEEIQESTAQSIRGFDAEDGGWRLGEAGELLRHMFAFQRERHAAGDISYHLSGHGFGALFIAAILGHRDIFETAPVISSANFLAPMLTIEQFRKAILPTISHPKDLPVRRHSRRPELVVETARIFTLDDDMMTADRCLDGYGASWPRLWSRASRIAAERSHPDVARQTRASEPFLAFRSAATQLATRERDLRIEDVPVSPGAAESRPLRHLLLDRRLDYFRTIVPSDG